MTDVLVTNYGGKSVHLAGTLAGLGFGLRDNILALEGVAAVFVDWPAGWAHYYGDQSVHWRLCQVARDRGVKVIGTPHGGNPSLHSEDTGFWEGQSCELVHAPGHKKLLESFGCPVPVVDVGWTFCPVRVFEERSIDRVVFAPTHPSASGSYRCDGPRQSEMFAIQNRVAYLQFLELPAPVKTVRFSGTLEQNGLWRDPRVTSWVKSDLTVGSSVRAIDRHDLVISDGTFMHLGVARGVATVSLGLPKLVDENGETFPGWDDYEEWVRYPFSLDRMPLGDAVERAGAMSEELAVWRDDWVGSELDPSKLRALL